MATYVRPGAYVKEVFLPPPPSAAESFAYMAGIVGTNYKVIEGQDAFAGLMTIDPAMSYDQFFEYPGIDPVFDEVLLDTVRVYLAPAAGTLPVRIEHFSAEYVRKFGFDHPVLGPVLDITEAVKAYEWTDASGTTHSGIYEGGVVIPHPIVDETATPARPWNSVSPYNDFQLKADSSGDKGWPDYSDVRVFIEYMAYRKPTARYTDHFETIGQVQFKLSYYPIKYSDPSDIEIIKYNTSTSTQTNITPVSVDAEAGIVTISNAYAVSSSDEYIEITYTIVNPVYRNPVMVERYEHIEEYFGPVHPMNRVAMGAWLALQRSDGVPVKVMVAEHEAPGSLKPDTESLQAALRAICADDDVYTVVVMENGPDVLEHIIAAFDEMEDIFNVNLFKITMVGFGGFNEATPALIAGDANQAVKDLQAKIFSLEDKRVRYLLNPAIALSYKGEDRYPIAGYFYAAIYAGQISSYMNRKGGLPNQPMSLSTVPGVVGVVWPNRQSKFFTETQLDALADSGYWILIEDNGVVYVRHQLTTAETQLTTAEDSIIRGVDYVALELKKRLRQFVGVRHLTQRLVDDEIRPLLASTLQQWVNDGIAGEGTEIVELYIDPVYPDRLIAKVKYQPLYPVNAIILTIVV